MSLSVFAARPKVKAPTESIMFGFDFTPNLPNDEELSSVTSVTCVSAAQSISGGSAVATGDLTIGSPAVNAAAFDDDHGGTVAIGHGAQARISGGVHGGDYVLACTVATDASNTRVMRGTLQVRTT